jgi:hypothetical protein
MLTPFILILTLVSTLVECNVVQQHSLGIRQDAPISTDDSGSIVEETITMVGENLEFLPWDLQSSLYFRHQT